MGNNRKRLLSASYRYAFTQLVLNFCTFYEILSANPAEEEAVGGKDKEFCGLVDGFLRGEDMREELGVLRGKIAADTERLSAYVDCFRVYEYVLSRIERRFVKRVPAAETPEELTDDIMELLEDSEDAVILDGRMRRVVAQLPVRYTRQKFYALLRDRLSVYIGAGKKELERLFYMMRSYAMIQSPEESEAAQRQADSEGAEQGQVGSEEVVQEHVVSEKAAQEHVVSEGAAQSQAVS